MYARRLRSAILAVLSLLLAGTLFGLYQYRETQTAPISLGSADPSPTPVAILDLPSEDEVEASISVRGEKMPIRPGGGFRYNLDDDTGRPRGDLTGQEWRPVGSGDEIEVVKPIIRLRTPRGQLIHVTADSGTVKMNNTNPRNPEPSSGRLVGDVRITIDRLSDEQRDTLCEEELNRTEGERFIKLYMDDIRLDLELARVETAGPFRVEAAETIIEGAGLYVRYNEIDSRVEELLVRNGRRIVVFGMNNRFSTNFGEKQPEEGEAEDRMAPAESAVEPTPPPAPAVAENTGGHEMPPLLAEDEPRPPRVRPTDEYIAVFEKDVAVAEYQNDQRVGGLVADQLRVLFDFSQRERDMARAAPPGMSVEEAVAVERETPAAELPPAIDRSRHIELTWTGGLNITSRRLTDRAPDTDQRVHIYARGKEVVIDDPKTHVECQELVYRNESEFVRLIGSDDRPAHVVMQGAGELFGAEIQLDRSAQLAHATGPRGRLITTQAKSLVDRPDAATGAEDPNASPLDIRFETEVRVRFGNAALARLNPRTGEMITTEREILESAVFVGDVDMVHGEDRIKCDRIELDFQLAPSGKQYPTYAHAFGNVRMAQGLRYISASDRVLVEFELLESKLDRPPFNLAIARQRAIDKGENPDELNWDAIREAYENSKHYRPGIRDLRAYGDVEVRDPGQRLDIDCAALECKFARGREIQSGLVTPREGETAFVALGDFSIAAPSPIPFDAVRQIAHVDGEGRMTFPSKQDIDGRVLDEPLLVSVAWKERMAFEGPRNEAVFHGGVNIESVNSQFTCASLRVEFANVENAEPPVIAADAADQQSRWWLLTPLVKWAGDDRDEARFTVTGPSFDKEPIYIYATGHTDDDDGSNVIAVSKNEDPKTGDLLSRVSIRGPIMAVDLRERYMNVEGAGKLLIEDYRRSSAKRAQQAASKPNSQVTPFGRVVGNEPSQTLIAWEEGMSYRDIHSTAEFRKDVALDYATGDKMRAVTTKTTESGRLAKLNCQSLIVQFVRTASADKQSGAGRMSGNDVGAFNASGQVYFEDSGVTAIAQQITYTRDDGGVLQILGTDEDPAEIFVQRRRFDTFKGPRFEWNRTTNRILGAPILGPDELTAR